MGLSRPVMGLLYCNGGSESMLCAFKHAFGSAGSQKDIIFITLK
jgi:hypothetical protein